MRGKVGRPPSRSPQGQVPIRWGLGGRGDRVIFSGEGGVQCSCGNKSYMSAELVSRCDNEVNFY